MRFLLVVLLGLVMNLQGQGNFLLIQEAGGRPFYVRMGDENFSSSPAGHLLLASLKDSTYNLYIGFPRSQAPEQLFSIRPGGVDRGFELRTSGNEWQLYDVVSGQQIPALRSSIHLPGGTRKTDAYSELMAGVVSDTAVLYNTLVTVAAADATVVAQPDPVQATVEQQPSAPAIATMPPAAAPSGQNSAPAGDGVYYDPRDIIRWGTENILEGKLMIYIDRSGPVADTIRLVIPRL